MSYNMNDYPASFKNLDHTVKKKAIERAQRIADNRDTKVIQYTKDGKKQ